jgi:hypothetical protein
VLGSPKEGEPVIPTMETSKDKIESDVSLGNLKCRIIVRGDLQDTAMEDSWSPTAHFRSFKMFIADAEYIYEIFGLSSKQIVEDR